MKKDFDAVEMMRAIRDRLHIEYQKNPELRKKRLAAIHNKYKFTGELATAHQ